MKNIILLAGSMLLPAFLQAQPPAEFPAGWSMYLEAGQGMSTAFRKTTEQYWARLNLSAQYALIPGYLRLGIHVGAYYSAQQLQPLAGTSLSARLTTWNAGLLGTAANLHLHTDLLWAGQQQKAVGGGIRAELLNRLWVGPAVHRVFPQHSWWLQAQLGWRFSGNRMKKEAFNQ